MRPHFPFLVSLCLLVPVLPVLGQAIFTVNSTDDPGEGTCDAGHCTLAEAFNAANATAASDTILFDIPGDGPHTIQPAVAFPAIVAPLYVDGYSQPGAQPATDDSPAILQIELDGQSASGDAHGLSILGRDTVIRGLVINRFPRSGVYIAGLSEFLCGPTTTGGRLLRDLPS